MSHLKPALSARDHLHGNRAAPIQLVEFGDYQCPFCGQAYSVVAALEQELGDRLCFSFRNFPLVQAHPHALVAAEAAEAADAQGKFWEMHDVLYQHQDALDPPDIEEFAMLIGLDLPRFKHDLRTHAFVEKIRADLHSGALSGVNGTPTFFVNGDRHDGSYDFDSLLGAIQFHGGAELGL
jgi:protein-disulfide isomerase